MSLAVCGMGRFMLHKRLWCLVRWRWSPNVLFVIRPMVRSPYQLNSWHWRLWPLGTGVSYVSYIWWCTVVVVCSMFVAHVWWWWLWCRGGSGGQTCSSHQLPLVTSAPGSRRRAIALIHLRPGAEKHPEAENPATTLMSQVHSNMLGLRTCFYRITTNYGTSLLRIIKSSKKILFPNQGLALLPFLKPGQLLVSAQWGQERGRDPRPRPPRQLSRDRGRPHFWFRLQRIVPSNPPKAATFCREGAKV